MKELAIGIDLGGTNLKGVVMDEKGSFRHLTRIPTEAEKGGSRVLENLISLIDALIKKEGTKDHIRGIGIGAPGFIDNDGTVLGGAENLPGWKGTNVFTPIRKKFAVAPTAGNDVTVTALAESRYGAGRGIHNMVCFALGTGIGGGIVANGHVYKGSHGMAGEFGHIIVDTSPNGRQCTCGLKGCVETYASATGIVRNAIEISEKTAKKDQTPFVAAVLADRSAVTSKLVYDFVKQGDAVAIQVNEFTCECLGRAVGMICNTNSPDRVILGGGVMMAGQIIVDTTAKYAARYCWPAIWERTDIVAAQCGENAGVLGAGALVFDEMK